MAITNMANVSLRRWALAITLMFAPVAVGAAATSPPSATAMLFDANHLANMTKGDPLTYRFERTVSDPKLLGEAFADDIRLGVVNDGPAGTREVTVNVFTGGRARPEQRIDGMTGNPVLVVFLDRAVNNLSMLAGGNRPYLKQKIKMSLAERAKVEPVEIDYKGKKVAGARVSVTPFLGDSNALKMMGYDGTVFQIVVSDAVPGHFVDFTSHYESPMKDSPKLDERIRLSGAGEIKAGDGK